MCYLHDISAGLMRVVCCITEIPLVMNCCHKKREQWQASPPAPCKSHRSLFATLSKMFYVFGVKKNYLFDYDFRPGLIFAPKKNCPCDELENPVNKHWRCRFAPPSKAGLPLFEMTRGQINSVRRPGGGQIDPQPNLYRFFKEFPPFLI